jgi:hypothetical protein
MDYYSASKQKNQANSAYKKKPLWAAFFILNIIYTHAVTRTFGAPAMISSLA